MCCIARCGAENRDGWKKAYLKGGEANAGSPGANRVIAKRTEGTATPTESFFQEGSLMQHLRAIWEWKFDEWRKEVESALGTFATALRQH